MREHTCRRLRLRDGMAWQQDKGHALLCAHGRQPCGCAQRCQLVASDRWCWWVSFATSNAASCAVASATATITAAVTKRARAIPASTTTASLTAATLPTPIAASRSRVASLTATTAGSLPRPSRRA